MPIYDTLLFDLDGTLFDFEATQEQALNAVFQLYKITLTDEIRTFYLQLNARLWTAYEDGLFERKDIVLNRFKTVFQKFGIACDGVQFGLDYQKELGKGHHLVPYAKRLCADLAGSYVMAIITNGTADTQYKRIRDAEIQCYFDYCFISDEIGSRKPEQAYFDYCFSKIGGQEKNKALIIGDSLSSDMLGGYVAGIDTCWYNPRCQDNIKNIPCTYEIHDLRELYKILEEL